MTELKKLFTSLVEDESGAGYVEYALLIVLIALVAMFGVLTLGEGLNTLFANLGSAIETAATPAIPTPFQ